MPIRERLEILYQEHLEDAELAKDAERSHGSVRLTGGKMLSASQYRFVGIAEYVLHGNSDSFKRNLSDAAECSLYVFEQYDAGKIDYPFDGSEVSVTAYKNLLDGLASGNFAVSHALAARLGGRDELDRRSNQFAKAFCYSLKHFTLKDLSQGSKWCEQLADVCQERTYEPFRGYCDVFAALVENNLSLANEGIARIALTHEVLARSNHWFAETEDELLSVWGIGMANLSRNLGISVDAAPPAIPDELLS